MFFAASQSPTTPMLDTFDVELILSVQTCAGSKAAVPNHPLMTAPYGVREWSAQLHNFF